MFTFLSFYVMMFEPNSKLFSLQEFTAETLRKHRGVDGVE
jgi:hypothetical protein